jgi:hypothetical protein
LPPKYNAKRQFGESSSKLSGLNGLSLHYPTSVLLISMRDFRRFSNFALRSLASIIFEVSFRNAPSNFRNGK